MKWKLLLVTWSYLCVPAVAWAQSRALVVVVDDAGIGEATARTARWILMDALRSHQVDVVDRQELDRIVPLGEELKSWAQEAGASQIYALRLSALGEKVIVEIQKLSPSLELVRNRRMSAKGPEELDVILPRLTKALITDQPVEQTARIDTVSAQEGKQWEKKPGEFLWGLGIMLGGVMVEGAAFNYGFDLKFAYEMEHFRLNVNLGGIFNADDDSYGASMLAVGVSYLPFKLSWSPYVGLDLGFMNVTANDKTGDGLGLVAHAGLELFRFHSARMLVEAGCMFPFFEVELSDQNSYAPVLYGMVAVMW